MTSKCPNWDLNWDLSDSFMFYNLGSGDETRVEEKLNVIVSVR